MSGFTTLAYFKIPAAVDRGEMRVMSNPCSSLSFQFRFQEFSRMTILHLHQFLRRALE
jgi:hypothetical protein